MSNVDCSAEDLQTLKTLIDCIIPPDDFPSATGNGVHIFILRLLQGDLSQRADEVRLGLASLNTEAMARYALPFAKLPGHLQVELLKNIESGGPMLASWTTSPPRFFLLMISLTHEGYFTDPGNGSNLDLASWKMIGYEARVPEVPVTEHWTERCK